MQQNRPPSQPAGSLQPSATSSRVVSGSSTPQLQAGPSQTTDLYRPLANALQKPLSHLIPTSITPSVPASTASLFQLDPASFAGRVQNKNILLEGQAAAISQPSALIKGKKLHRGHPEIRKRAREEAERVQAERKEAGVQGMRKVKRRIKDGERGAVLQSGMKISYASMIPLNHLHLSYLAHLLSLPSLPSPIPSVPSSSSSPPALPPGLSAEGIQSRLCKADLTGLSLSVQSARNPSLVGLSGIVLEETASTFRIISADDVVRVIPKSGTMFEVLIPAYAPRDFAAAGELYVGPNGSGRGQVGEWPDPVDWDAHLAMCPRIRVLLLGTAFGFRSGDRAGRKFRPAQGGGGGSGWGEEWIKGEWSGVLEAVERDIESRREASGFQDAVGKDKQAHMHMKRKRGKARRKDPPAWGRLEVL